jgi:hypothetical protein
VLLADIEDIEHRDRESLLQQKRDSIAQARASVRNPGRKPLYTPEEAAERERRAKADYAMRKYLENVEASRAAARERMAKLRKRRRGDVEAGGHVADVALTSKTSV